MVKTSLRILVCPILFGSSTALATSVTCTASCVMSSDTQVVTVLGKGVDIQDALIELKEACDSAAKKAGSATHYLATSIVKPNNQFTSSRTEFSIDKACR